MISLNSFIIILIIVFVLLLLLLLFLCCRTKKIGYKRYLELMDIGNDLTNEIQTFISRKTEINFKFIYLGGDETYEEIKCEYFNLDIKVENESFNCIIDEKNGLDKNEYINALINEKIVLSKGDKKVEFFIDVYFHQKNNYYLIIDIQKDHTYSLDTIYYSNKINLIPEKIKFEKDGLILDSYYNINGMRRICLINLEKNICGKFINSITDINIDEKEDIFKNNIYDIFMNIRIKDGYSKESSIFLNKKQKKVYNLNNQDLNLLNNFNEKIIEKYINKYGNYNIKDINSNLEEKFLKNINEFVSKNNAYNSIKISETQNINNLDTEPTPLFVKNNINESAKKKGGKNYKLSLDLNEIEKEKNLSPLIDLVTNFFESPLDKRYTKEPSKEDFEIMEKMCLLSLSINANLPLESIISFYKIKNKILKEIKDFSFKEKIKVICCIKCHLNQYISSNIKLQKFTDLSEKSPYLRGELFYRNIIKNLNEKSKLKFIFLQLNSGGGYDFIKQDFCYLLKMIPLIVIKSHLLYKSEDYFFTYSNIRTDKLAFIDPYSRVESINEIKAFESENISNLENKDNEIKVCLLQIHEKGGHKKYTEDEKSPRYFISNELNLIDNYDKETDSGESGYALETFLFGDKIYISALIECKNLDNLAEYRLFTEEKENKLLQEIMKIFKRNKKRFFKNSGKKLINSSEIHIDARKYSYLKTYEKANAK